MTAVHITGLTQATGGSNGTDPQALRVFVEIRDSYDSKLKAPMSLRFELYTYVPHRSDPRGRHLQVWLDFVLLDRHKNHLYWRDYLRAYEFSLEVEPLVNMNEPMLLEVTCLTCEGKQIRVFYILNDK